METLGHRMQVCGLRMTRVDGKQGVYAVYAGDDLAGVVSGISQEEREEMLRTLREIC